MLRTAVLVSAFLLLASCTEPVGRPGTRGHDASVPRGDGGGTPAATETCNGTDDDRDGLVDEDCSCGTGATQACWPGDPALRGRGACADGAQSCLMGVEFGAWGACEGATLPSAEVEGNCVDEDCDGNLPGCSTPCGEFETCGNGVDDDCNELTDCEDPACDCPIDCSRQPERCSCEERCIAGTQRYCDEPEFCAWGLQDCGPDGRWGACTETRMIPSECIEEPPIPLPFPTPTTYDPECCVRAGLCCQNYGHDPSLGIDASIGSCAGRVERVCEPT